MTTQALAIEAIDAFARLMELLQRGRGPKRAALRKATTTAKRAHARLIAHLDSTPPVEAAGFTVTSAALDIVCGTVLIEMVDAKGETFAVIADVRDYATEWYADSDFAPVVRAVMEA